MHACECMESTKRRLNNRDKKERRARGIKKEETERERKSGRQTRVERTAHWGSKRTRRPKGGERRSVRHVSGRPAGKGKRDGEKEKKGDGNPELKRTTLRAVQPRSRPPSRLKFARRPESLPSSVHSVAAVVR